MSDDHADMFSSGLLFDAIDYIRCGCTHKTLKPIRGVGLVSDALAG